MTVNILIMTHENVGEALVNVTKAALDGLPVQPIVFSIGFDCQPEFVTQKIKQHLTTLGEDDGALILTDIFGSTPDNLARQFQQEPRVKIVAGLNLPMLFRVMNYTSLTLDELTEKAISGGHDGVLACEPA